MAGFMALKYVHVRMWAARLIWRRENSLPTAGVTSRPADVMNSSPAQTATQAEKDEAVPAVPALMPIN